MNIKSRRSPDVWEGSTDKRIHTASQKALGTALQGLVRGGSKQICSFLAPLPPLASPFLCYFILNCVIKLPVQKRLSCLTKGQKPMRPFLVLEDEKRGEEGWAVTEDRKDRLAGRTLSLYQGQVANVKILYPHICGIQPIFS